MSTEKIAFDESILNFNKDVHEFSELIKKISDYKQKFEIHITQFKEIDDLKSIAQNAQMNLTYEWNSLVISTESIEKELIKINKKLEVKKEISIFAVFSKKENIKSLEQIIDKKIEKNKTLETITSKKECSLSMNRVSENKINNDNFEDASLLTNIEEKAFVEIENESTITAIEASVSSNTTLENFKKDANLNDEILPKQGSIRVVPLQNLISSPTEQIKNTSICPWVISDSDEDTNTSIPENVLKESVLELSDSNSDEDEMQQRVKDNLLSIETKTGPRRKITPLRNKLEISQTQNNDELNLFNKSKLKENSATCNLSIKKCSNNEINHEKNLDFTQNVDDSDESSKLQFSIDKNIPFVKTTAPSLSLLASVLKSKAKECHKTNSSELFQRSLWKKCIVRIKRLSLTTNNIILDNPANTRNKHQTKKSSLRKEKFKAMASDSDSEKDCRQDKKESDASIGKEIVTARKKRLSQSKQKKDSDSDWEVQGSNRKTVTTRKKRKVICSSSGSSSGSDVEGSDNKQRKKIRKVMNEKNLDDGTKRATKEEEERRKRIEERQKVYNKIYVKPENIEIDALILDFDEQTKKPLLKVDDGLMKKLKPHQVNGVKFMWDACFETLKDCKEKPGSGCILAHCMGLGKTMQIVTLSHTLLTNSESTNVERVLIISPLSTLNNWAREFVHWMNFAKNKNVEIYDMSKYKDKNTRVFKLEEWFNEGGVCIVGYDMYRILSNEKTKGLRKKQKESLQKSLVNPGPDVVVCDEGHLLKNEKTSLSQAVTKMHTKRRIVLTGTPLQNNLKEYYCMIQFIKPNLLGTYKEYLNRFVNPISNGQYTDSTPRDIRLMKHRSHILHKMLEACIQRRDYSVLAPYLPPKYEYVVFCTLSEKQKEIYEYYMTKQRDNVSEINGVPGKGAKLFQDFQNLRRIWTHPMNLRVNSDIVIKKKMAHYDSEESLKDFVVEDSEDSTSSDSDSTISFGEAETNDNKVSRSRNTRANRDISDNDECFEIPAKDDPSEWWTQFVEDADLNNINHSPKLVLLMTLLQRCEEIGDKVLVFSQSLQSLDVIEHFLSLIDKKTRGQQVEADVADFKGFWKAGVDYFRLDGSRTVENRENMCKSFNNINNLKARLFLISTRAGGLGINLVAANRVVIFDVSWNPSHDTQSIFRVYRFGQTKPCYIYRLIALGTMEQKVYERQVAKQATAKRVIDEQQISRHYNQSDLQELYSYELEPSTSREIPILPKDRLFAELLSNYEMLVFKYHEHDSLLENEDSENLSEEERKAAWDEYEAEKIRPPQSAMQYLPYERQSFLANYGNPAGTVTSNKIFGFRSDILLRLLNMKGARDHPELTSNQVVQLVPEYLQRLYLEMNNDDPTLYMELVELHKTLEAPGGMYMNPLLFANQTPAPPAPSAAFITSYRAASYAQMHPSTSNFNSNEVYEVD